MPNLTLADLQGEIQANVRTALAEDVGGGDLTAQLIDPQREAEARVITREHATIAGRAWVDEVFRQVDPRVLVTWQVEDGQRVEPNQMLFQLKGPARALLTGERSATQARQLARKLQILAVRRRPRRQPSIPRRLRHERANHGLRTGAGAELAISAAPTG